MATRRTEGGVPAAKSACGQGPCFRVRVCLRAGTSDRCAPPVLSLPPLRGRSLPFTKPRAATPSEVPAHPAFPGRGTMLRPLGCRDCPRFDLLAASIRKSGLEIENRCTDCPSFYLLAAAIANSGPEIKNHCSAIVPASRIARLRRRCRNGAASDSNFLRCKVLQFRLQQSSRQVE